MDSSIFFPHDEDSAKNLSAARQVCTNCTMMQTCLRYAVLTREEHGIWGGYNSRQRFNIRRAWRKSGFLVRLEREGLLIEGAEL